LFLLRLKNNFTNYSGDVNIYSIRDPQDALILVETLSLKKIGEYQHRENFFFFFSFLF